MDNRGATAHTSCVNPKRAVYSALGTLLLYCLSGALLVAVFGERQIFGKFLIPVCMILLGSLQGRTALIIHVCFAVVPFLAGSWFEMPFDPNVGLKNPDYLTHIYLTEYTNRWATIAYWSLTLVTALRNGHLGLRGLPWMRPAEL